MIAVYAWCVCRGEGNGSVCLRGEEMGEGGGEGRNEVPSYSASSSVTATIHRVAW